VILDVMMPEMDGVETCARMNEDPVLKNTIKIFLTARNEDYSQIAGFESGADDYVTKPIKPKVLLVELRPFSEEEEMMCLITMTKTSSFLI
jgi:two-component system alkaline phosphatase synthesis response regulator PhoP